VTRSARLVGCRFIWRRWAVGPHVTPGVLACTHLGNRRWNYRREEPKGTTSMTAISAKTATEAPVREAVSTRVGGVLARYGLVVVIGWIGSAC